MLLEVYIYRSCIKIFTKQNKKLGRTKCAFTHSCQVYLSSLTLSMLILPSALGHRNIKASGGMDVLRKAVFYSTVDEWNMNREWQLAEHWQADRHAG